MNKKAIRRYIMSRPSRWVAASQLLVAHLLGRPDVRLRADGLTLVSGTGMGQGIWCGLGGLDYEPELRLFLNQLRPGDTVIDVGANIGVYSLRACRAVGPTGRVIAIEAHPVNVKRLAQGQKLNSISNLSIVAAAAGDRAGSIELFTGGRASSASIVRKEQNGGEVVPMRTIDEVVAQLGLGRVDWVKMDIEGAEPLALRGMHATLRRYYPSFLYENDLGGPETSSMLESEGYLIGRMNPDGSLHPTRSGHNLFAKKRAQNIRQ